MASNQNIAFAMSIHAESKGKETKNISFTSSPMEPEVNGATAEEQELGWGRSLPVPSVQEIVRKDPNCVPERYIRDQFKRDEISKLSDLNIPVIDFSKLSGGDDEAELELNKLDLACKDWGFFQVSST